MKLTEEIRAEVARAMGMKPAEVVAVDEVDAGLVVTTHDGVRSLLTEGGGVEPYAPSPVEVAKEELAELVQQPPATPENPVTGAPVNVVPEGSEKDVLDWVGEDKERAGLALKVEQNHAKPRKGLVEKLQKLAG